MPPRPAASLPRWTDDPATVRPMLASSLTGSASTVTSARARHVFERKLDGMRALAHARARLTRPRASGSGLAERPRQDAPVPRPRPRTPALRRGGRGAPAARRRGGGARRPRRTDHRSWTSRRGSTSATGPRDHAQGHGRARRLRRLRPAARGWGGPARPAADRSEGAPGEGVPHPRIGTRSARASSRPANGERWLARAVARAMGRPHREGRRPRGTSPAGAAPPG